MLKRKILAFYNQLKTSHISKDVGGVDFIINKNYADDYFHQFNEHGGIFEMEKTKNLKNSIIDKNSLNRNIAEIEKKQEVYVIDKNQGRILNNNSSITSELLMSLKRFETIYYDESTPIQINRFNERNIVQASIV